MLHNLAQIGSEGADAVTCARLLSETRSNVLLFSRTSGARIFQRLRKAPKPSGAAPTPQIIQPPCFQAFLCELYAPFAIFAVKGFPHIPTESSAAPVTSGSSGRVSDHRPRNRPVVKDK